MDILYKYVTANRALNCIPEVGDGTLRATQPAALNDPFECAVTPLYVIRDASEENRLLAESLTEINESTPVTEEHVHCAREQYGSLFTRQLFAKQVSTKLKPRWDLHLWGDEDWLRRHSEALPNVPEGGSTPPLDPPICTFHLGISLEALTLTLSRR